MFHKLLLLGMNDYLLNRIEERRGEQMAIGRRIWKIVKINL